MAYKNIFALPVSQKRQASLKRRFIVFSASLFLLILTLGSAAFVFLIGQMTHRNVSQELKKTIELERLKLEVSIKSEIAIVLKMADSPLIKRYFINPDDPVLKQYAFEEIEAYSTVFENKFVFWINDKDKLFHTTGYETFKVNPEDPDNYWYNMTLYEKNAAYNFNINYNPDLNVTNLWINATVFNNNKEPIGILGTGINLSNFIDEIYRGFPGPADLYFFNASGEITGAKNINLAERKITVNEELGSAGGAILDNIKFLKSKDIKILNVKNADGVIAYGSIPDLEWYIAAVYNFHIRDELRTGMTFLFAVMMTVILIILIIINIFISRLLEPLYHIVKEIGRLSSDWDLNSVNESNEKDEIETLGEFLNMTVIDPLTKIYNRRFFDGNMKMLIKLLSRVGNKLSLLMIDIDFFKKYNDTYGHDMGDTCLITVATTISKCIIREEDFAARYGGEEFVVVLPNTDENGAQLIANRLLNKIRECNIPHKSSDIADIITVSIGVTTGIVSHLLEESDFIKCADAAMYVSKQNGRNQYSFKAFEAAERDLF
jgi:methyl-accepting chemotaxis protein